MKGPSRPGNPRRDPGGRQQPRRDRRSPRAGGARPTRPDPPTGQGAEGWLPGRQAVREALRAGRELNKVLVARGARGGSLGEVLALARQRGVPVQEVDRRRLDELVPGTVHQGVAAQAAARAYAELEDLLSSGPRDALLLLCLDGVEDPHNLGALLRSAEAAGARGVVIPRRRAAGLTPGAARASAGAIEYVPVARVPNLAACLQELEAQGIRTVGADPGADRSLWQEDLTGPLALVVGGEGRGLSRLVRERCSSLVRIPMQGRVASVNASVAGSLLLFEALRQRLAVRPAAPPA